MHGFKDIDPYDVDVKALLDGIAREHDARIEAEEIDSTVSVTVQTTNRAKAKAVIAALRKVFLYRPGEETVWRARLLVSPPKDGTYALVAVLQPKEGTTGRRALAATPKVPTLVDQAGLVATETDYKKSLIKILDETAGHLRHIPNGMRMRVHFGSLVMDEWKKDKTEYTFTELESHVSRSGARGTAHMLNT
jgi:hypothetical protein